MKQLKELKTGTERERTLLARCRDSIRSLDPSVEIILYGSRARGDANPESDYDLLILTDGEATLKREDSFRRKLFPIELETGAVLTVSLVSRKDWNSALYGAMPFHQNVVRDGVIL
ncbi:MAG: nucleotidyltransferase domain-containing protein [Deltaproteobacteria bacterium]|nr:nucleotidyltransferase domain-containing protein [Deltaproteobacteria bacterium]MBW2341766.1 nucleotidyltransferase domain-containing protein [Deltaproteobacteria bacterium]